MIEYIKGELAECSPAYAVVDAVGVGYGLNITLNTYTAIQGKDKAKLYVYESIREDAYQLFGFATKQEREMFLLLISVSGVGANTARMILSEMTAAELCQVISSGNEKLLKTAQSQYDRGVEMMQQGQMAKADVVQLEAQLSSAKYDVTNSQTQLLNYKRQLKALLELDLNTTFDVSGQIPTDQQVMDMIPSAQEAYAQALNTRPEIKSALLAIEAADMQLDIARRGYYPTLSLSASLGDSHYSASKNNVGKQMKDNLNLSAGITVSVPIFDNRQNRANVKTAILEQTNTKLDLQDKKNTLSSTIEQYWINAVSNQQNFIAAKDRVKSQEASYELLNEQFQNGLKNTVEVLQGRDNLISAEQDLLQSKYTTLLNIQLLKFYTGEKIDL